MLQNLSSAAVVIGTLRVKTSHQIGGQSKMLLTIDKHG